MAPNDSVASRMRMARIAFASYWILRLASQSAKWLSPLARRLATRLMGLLLAALALQFIFNGVRSAELFSGNGS